MSAPKGTKMKFCPHKLLTGEGANAFLHGGAIRPNGKIGPEYRAWQGMKDRCTNPNSNRYHRYGGRGITFCKRWESFANFFLDMGKRPGPDYSLERKRLNDNYQPDNCIWATIKMQCRNTSRTRFVEFNGSIKPLIDFIEELGMPKKAVYRRVRDGWSVERALTVPLKTYSK